MATEEKTREQKAEEAKLRAAKRERQLLTVLKRVATMEDEAEIVEFLEALTHKVTASVIRKAAGDGMFPLEFGEWVIAQSEDDSNEIDVIKSTATYQREKVTRDYPAKFDRKIFFVDDNDKIDKKQVVNQELLDHGKEFYENLKQFLVDNKINLDVFEKNDEYWRSYFRTGTEEDKEAKKDVEAGNAAETDTETPEPVDESPI